ARPVGGDDAAGQVFLRGLTPFIWRKHLDFAAIADIFSIRRQINHKIKPRQIQNFTHGKDVHSDENYYAEFSGYNLKLGQGGIREIEFFAQTQQLVWGGRLPHVRAAGTIAALGELVKAKLCDENSAALLRDAYYFLRRAEHRLQMIDDQQTQTLPSDPLALENFAQFMGFDNFASFAKTLKIHLNHVIAVGSKFFENNTSLSDPSGGNLVFTGADNDPDTLSTLSHLGYAKAAQIADTIRGWHHGRIRATRTTRAREILTELTPTILNSLAQTPEPDASFARFDRFLTSLPSGVDFFSLLRANPHLLDLLAVIMGAAPILAEQLSDMPSLLDCLVMAGGDFSANLIPSDSDIGTDLRHYVGEISHYEDFLDRVRRWSAERRFQLGLALLQRDLETPTASHLLSRQADEVIAVMIERVAPYVLGKNPNTQSNSPQSDPSPPNFAVIGYGKLGARELTLDSDLDLVFVFDSELGQNDTAPQLPPGFHTRFCQRLIAALTTQTANGGLYRIDMRLRPDGEKGGIVTHFDGFADYHRHNAWIFERMAMTRARVVYAAPNLRTKIDAVLLECLTRPAPSEKIQHDVSEMRRMITEQHPPRHFLDLKYLQGGLIDLEFMTQFWLLRHAEASRPIFAEWLSSGAEKSAVTPEFLRNSATRHALAGLRQQGLIDAEIAENFIAAHHLFSQCQFLLRLCLGEGWRGDEVNIPSSVKSVLADAANCPDWSHLLALIEDTRTAIKLACAKIY
ncbi:MAG: glutamine-synthetase adenylyltransferase, partial [Alphaproteobacteria bacterium]|nr:glutamine-synthetase adenylyltransferase [Alphaproteobacteria bacterium]